MIVYPLIEEFWEDFIRSHEDAIHVELPISSGYGEMYENTKDVELGALVFMMGSRRLSVTQGEYKKLVNFRLGRNKLAYHDALDSMELCALYQ